MGYDIELKKIHESESYTVIYSGQCLSGLQYHDSIKTLEDLAAKINSSERGGVSHVALLIKSRTLFHSHNSYTDTMVSVFIVKFGKFVNSFTIKPLEKFN